MPSTKRLRHWETPQPHDGPEPGASPVSEAQRGHGRAVLAGLPARIKPMPVL